MASISVLQNAWSTLSEMDVGTLRAQVQKPFPVAILGRDQARRQWLADALRTDPFSKGLTPLGRDVSLLKLPLDRAGRSLAARAKLALIAVAAGREDLTLEEETIADLLTQNPHLPIIVVQVRPDAGQELYAPMLNVWRGAVEVVVDPYEDAPFDAELAPQLHTLLPDDDISLGYRFPALRPWLVRRLVQQTSMANATYAATTGLAEIVPVLLLPGNVADFFVLTKNQSIMAYKIALLMGNDVGVQETAGELAGVFGSGFLWRESARRLVGLVPGWGLLPKVAVAYAGTYIVGEAAYYWYAWHERMSADQLRNVYRKALDDGRQKAAELVSGLKQRQNRRKMRRAGNKKRLALPGFRRKERSR